MFPVDYKFSISYLRLLKKKYSGLNLTQIDDLELFHVEQFLDSLAPLEKSAQFKASLKKKKVLLDVGFGGGFPILPLASRCPESTFVGLEGREKKVLAVRDIADELGLTNVSLSHHRVEDVNIDVPCIITFKAVGTILRCLKWLQLTTKCEVYFYKGPHFGEKEGLNGRKWAMEKEWRSIEDISFEVGHVSRRLLGFENKSVPRGTFVSGKIRKSLVKLSSLL